MSLIKSKKRVADHGEVFTPPWLVEAMLDLVKGETERIDSRFLEPACGSGNFLVPILQRKLAANGLKATDAAAAARAAADCAQADAHARAAQREARTDYYHKQRQRAWAQINRTLGEISDYADEYGNKHVLLGMRARVPADDVLMNALQATLAGWTDWLEALRREEADSIVVPAQAGTHTP